MEAAAPAKRFSSTDMPCSRARGTPDRDAEEVEKLLETLQRFQSKVEADSDASPSLEEKSALAFLHRRIAKKYTSARRFVEAITHHEAAIQILRHHILPTSASCHGSSDAMKKADRKSTKRRGSSRDTDASLARTGHRSKASNGDEESGSSSTSSSSSNSSSSPSPPSSPSSAETPSSRSPSPSLDRTKNRTKEDYHHRHVMLLAAGLHDLAQIHSFLEDFQTAEQQLKEAVHIVEGTEKAEERVKQYFQEVFNRLKQRQQKHMARRATPSQAEPGGRKEGEANREAEDPETSHQTTRTWATCLLQNSHVRGGIKDGVGLDELDERASTSLVSRRNHNHSERYQEKSESENGDTTRREEPGEQDVHSSSESPYAPPVVHGNKSIPKSSSCFCEEREDAQPATDKQNGPSTGSKTPFLSSSPTSSFTDDWSSTALPAISYTFHQTPSSSPNPSFPSSSTSTASSSSTPGVHCANTVHAGRTPARKEGSLSLSSSFKNSDAVGEALVDSLKRLASAAGRAGGRGPPVSARCRLNRRKGLSFRERGGRGEESKFPVYLSQANSSKAGVALEATTGHTSAAAAGNTSDNSLGNCGGTVNICHISTVNIGQQQASNLNPSSCSRKSTSVATARDVPSSSSGGTLSSTTENSTSSCPRKATTDIAYCYRNSPSGKNRNGALYCTKSHSGVTRGSLGRTNGPRRPPRNDSWMTPRTRESCQTLLDVAVFLNRTERTTELAGGRRAAVKREQPLTARGGTARMWANQQQSDHSRDSSCALAANAEHTETSLALLDVSTPHSEAKDLAQSGGKDKQKETWLTTPTRPPLYSSMRGAGAQEKGCRETNDNSLYSYSRESTDATVEETNGVDLLSQRTPKVVKRKGHRSTSESSEGSGNPRKSRISISSDYSLPGSPSSDSDYDGYFTRQPQIVRSLKLEDLESPPSRMSDAEAGATVDAGSSSTKSNLPFSSAAEHRPVAFERRLYSSDGKGVSNMEEDASTLRLSCCEAAAVCHFYGVTDILHWRREPLDATTEETRKKAKDSVGGKQGLSSHNTGGTDNDIREVKTANTLTHRGLHGAVRTVERRTCACRVTFFCDRTWRVIVTPFDLRGKADEGRTQREEVDEANRRAGRARAVLPREETEDLFLPAQMELSGCMSSFDGAGGGEHPAVYQDANRNSENMTGRWFTCRLPEKERGEVQTRGTPTHLGSDTDRGTCQACSAGMLCCSSSKTARRSHANGSPKSS
ncbi:UNVERIFIED_CONTAM: tetratricopeptide repeat-containing protein [Hammondia hammondi]|eukprot:XP_008882562.1 tetratricopeptide repeat-containing protein [Hammondia hammondi]